MKYRSLGNTGVKVSSLCMGTMTFGDGADKKTSELLYNTCRDKGINFFDCANGYAKGESERILGQLIKPHREEVLIATKVYFPTGPNINDRGLSRSHMTKALDASLKRLDTDYIDVYYLHHFDEETALEETFMALDDFVGQGKIQYIGVSNFSAWQIMKAKAIIETRQLAAVSCVQPMYSLLKRQAESELLPMASSEAMGVFSYSPLAGGLLTGKYSGENPGNGRFDTNKMYQNRYRDRFYQESVDAYVQFAQEHQLDAVSLAIAWVMSNPAVTAPIIGARNLQQLEPCLAALEIELTDEMMAMLDQISPPAPLATDREEER